MPINPKSLIPDVKRALALLPLVSAGALPEQRAGAAAELQAILEFTAAALGDPEALQAVMQWALEAPAEETLEALKAGRVPPDWLAARRRQVLA